MKIGKILSAIAAFAIIGTINAANTSAELKAGDIVKQGNSLYYLVRVFATPEQNASFQRDLDIMRRHAIAIDKFKLKIKELDEAAKKFASDAKKTEAIKNDKEKVASALDKLIKDFAINEEAMKKIYGFVSNRDYRVTYDESNVCTPLTKSELSSLTSSDGKKLDPLKILTQGNSSYYILNNIDGTKANEELQRMLGYSISRKNEIDKLREELANTVDPQEQLKISSRIAASEKAMQENEAKLRKTYGIGKDQAYSIQVSKSKLFLIITPEEERELRARFDSQAAK